MDAVARATEGGMRMSEVIIRAVSAILTTIGLMAINSGHINIGYPMFGAGLFWLTYREE